MTAPLGPRVADGRPDAATAIESTVARLLQLGTYIGIGLVLVGVAGMLVAGMSPLEMAKPAFNPAQIPAEILALEPEGFLWAGLLTFMALPLGRVVVSGAGFLAAGDRVLVLVSVLVVVVVVVSIVAAQVVQV